MKKSLEPATIESVAAATERLGRSMDSLGRTILDLSERIHGVPVSESNLPEWGSHIPASLDGICQYLERFSDRLHNIELDMNKVRSVMEYVEETPDARDRLRGRLRQKPRK